LFMFDLNFAVLELRTKLFPSVKKSFFSLVLLASSVLTLWTGSRCR